jgi:hypothetical protein
VENLKERYWRRWKELLGILISLSVRGIKVSFNCLLNMRLDLYGCMIWLEIGFNIDTCLVIIEQIWIWKLIYIELKYQTINIVKAFEGIWHHLFYWVCLQSNLLIMGWFFFKVNCLYEYFSLFFP